MFVQVWRFSAREETKPICAICAFLCVFFEFDNEEHPSFPQAQYTSAGRAAGVWISCKLMISLSIKPRIAA